MPTREAEVMPGASPRGAAVVLAGGASRRMGRPKSLLPLGGSTFLGNILGHLRQLPLDIFVVTSPAVPLDLPERVVVNPDPDSGQLRSLQLALEAGARALPFTLVALVDQPLVQAETYAALLRAVSANPAAHMWVPASRGRRGHPVVFAEVCYGDLLAADPAAGMRSVVALHRHLRHQVEVADPGILKDFDTPESYASLQGE